MRVEIRGRDFEVTDALRHCTERQVEVALHPFRERIEGIEASLADLNGPRGGIDKQCRLRARLVPGGVVIAHATDADLYVAIVQAVRRLAGRVERALALRRQMRADTRLSLPEQA